MSATMTNSYAKDRFYVVVGETIRKTRTAADVSQEKLAKAAGINLSTLQNAEGGMSCSLYLLARIADGLDTTLDELVPTEAT